MFLWKLGSRVAAEDPRWEYNKGDPRRVKRKRVNQVARCSRAHLTIAGTGAAAATAGVRAGDEIEELFVKGGETCLNSLREA